jgi:hypothetical protein
VKTLAKDKFSLMAIEEWVSVCRCVKGGEKIYVRNKHVVDSILRIFFINIGHLIWIWTQTERVKVNV